MHTPNQGLTYMFKFSAVLIICSLYECSLPSIPFPLFPSRFPFPRSLPEAVSGVCDSHESPSFQVCAFPSLLFPSHCSLPSFPIDDYVPALFPYWRLCSRPPFLFSIMLPFPFPIFDYALTLSVLDVLMLLLQDCWKCNFCAVSAWVNGPDNYYLCTKLYSKVPHYFSAGEPSWNNECSRPLK
jgi:hypothetical protein